MNTENKRAGMPKDIRELRIEAARILKEWGREAGIVKMVVASRHVSETDFNVANYTVSRLKPECSWAVRLAVHSLATRYHRQNRRLYAFVMGGSHE